MENANARFIIIDEPTFFELLDQLYTRLKGNNEKTARWISGDEVMRMLNISSPTTMQKLRDDFSSGIIVSQLSKKLFLYDRESVEQYIANHKRK
jgi:hypothetical protein